MEMKQYRVVSSQIVYSYIVLEAESKDEACELAYQGDHDWKEFDYGTWEIEYAEELNG